jgi:hypothetical protein
MDEVPRRDAGVAVVSDPAAVAGEVGGLVHKAGGGAGLPPPPKVGVAVLYLSADIPPGVIAVAGRVLRSENVHPRGGGRRGAEPHGECRYGGENRRPLHSAPGTV